MRCNSATYRYKGLWTSDRRPYSPPKCSSDDVRLISFNCHWYKEVNSNGDICRYYAAARHESGALSVLSFRSSVCLSHASRSKCYVSELYGYYRTLIGNSMLEIDMVGMTPVLASIYNTVGQGLHYTTKQ